MLNSLHDGIDFSSYLTPTRAEIVRSRNPPEVLVAEMTIMGEQTFIYIRK